MVYSFLNVNSNKIYITFSNIYEGNDIIRIVENSSGYRILPPPDFVREINMSYVGKQTALCFIPSKYSISYVNEYYYIIYQLRRNNIEVIDCFE